MDRLRDINIFIENTVKASKLLFFFIELSLMLRGLLIQQEEPIHNYFKDHIVNIYCTTGDCLLITVYLLRAM